MIKAVPEGARLLRVPDKAERWEDQRKSYSINHKWLSEEQKQLLRTANHPASQRMRKQAIWVNQGTAEGRVAQQWTLQSPDTDTPYHTLDGHANREKCRGLVSLLFTADNLTFGFPWVGV